MKFARVLLSILAVIAMTNAAVTAAQVQNNRGQQDGGNNVRIDERDFVGLSDYMATKRNIDLKEKMDNLKISGDVRFEWRHLNETGLKPIVTTNDNTFEQNSFFESANYQSLRGGNRTDPYTIKKPSLPRGLRLSKNDFDVELNLAFKYETDKSYAVAQLGFDNSCGASDNGWWNSNEDPGGFHGSGIGDKVSLKRAYWGYSIYSKNGINFDVELGRHKVYDVFESEIMYGSRLDGLTLYLSKQQKGAGEVYLTGAVWVVDERCNHYVYGLETGVMNLLDQDIDIKYSFVNWNKYGQNRFFVRRPPGMRFQVNQLLVTYHLNPDWFCGKAAEVYGAVVYNSDPHLDGRRLVDGDKNQRNFVFIGKDKYRDQRWAGYVGFLIGKVRKEGDWSAEIQYQYAQPYAFPQGDDNGIGIGNCLDESQTYQLRGGPNYKGFRIQGLYALTDFLSVDTRLEVTRAVNKKIGGKHHYSCFEIEAIYAF